MCSSFFPLTPCGSVRMSVQTGGRKLRGWPVLETWQGGFWCVRDCFINWEMIAWITGSQVKTLNLVYFLKVSLVRNSLGVSVSSTVLLCGIYMYTGNDTDLLNESIEVVFDRGTTVLTLYKDNSILSQTVTVSYGISFINYCLLSRWT